MTSVARSLENRGGHAAAVIVCLALGPWACGDDSTAGSGEDSSGTAAPEATDGPVATDGPTNPGDTATDDATGTPPLDDTSDTTTPGAECGDGVVEGEEVCDDGRENGDYGKCLGDCSGLGPHCGDAMVDAAEECDDGNIEDLDGCSMECLLPGSVAWQHELTPPVGYSMTNLVLDGVTEGGVVLGAEVHANAANVNDTWLRRLLPDGSSPWDAAFGNPAWLDSDLGNLQTWADGDADHAVYVVGSSTTAMGTNGVARWYDLDGNEGPTVTTSSQGYNLVDVGPTGTRLLGIHGPGAVTDTMEYFPALTGPSTWSNTNASASITYEACRVDPVTGFGLQLLSDGLSEAAAVFAFDTAGVLSDFVLYHANDMWFTRGVDLLITPEGDVLMLGNYDGPEGNVGFVRLLDPALDLLWQETGPVGVRFDAFDLDPSGRIVVAGSYGTSFGSLHLFQLMAGGALAFEWEVLALEGDSVDVAFDGLGAIYRASTSPDAVWKHAG